MNFRNLFYLLTIAIPVLLQGCEDVGNTEQSYKERDITFKLSNDSTYQYTIKNRVSVQQQLDEDNVITMEQNLTLTTTYDLVETKGDNKTVSVTYEHITMSSGNQLLSVEFDSETDNGAIPLYEDLRYLIDKPFKMTISARGDIISSESLVTRKEDANSSFSFDDNSMRKILVHTLSFYPDRPVMMGDTWKNEFSTSAGFTNIIVRCGYQLTEIKDGIAHIELKGKITTANITQAQGTTADMKGTQEGSYDVEIATGMVVNASIKQSLNGTMNITGELTPATLESGIYIMGKKK